jgi:hypothetical protein
MLQALDSEVGIAVQTNDPDLLRKKCYSIRNKARQQDISTYDSLVFRISPTNSDSELWIFNGDIKNGKTETKP